MTYEIDKTDYKVIIERKNNKNTYIRVKEDLTIFVTTHYLVSDKEIQKLLLANENYLKKVLNKRVNQLEKKDTFYLLGKEYDIILVPRMKGIDIEDNKILVENKDFLTKWLKKKTKEIFIGRLEEIIRDFSENIKEPDLKIRKMKTRWGVYNRKTHYITLNSNLIEYNIEIIDYVIVHELSHIIHFDHSKNFWNLVETNCPNYKKYRKILKD